MIPVTQPFFPPRQSLDNYIDGIYDRKWLTNNGPLLVELEQKLEQRLAVDHCRLVANGTLALQLAVKALELTGEVITTPFSYVATTSSLVWEGCQPVFVDIDPYNFNIDPAKIEAAITPRTTGILATHIFGIPCDVTAIRDIADRHGLKVIYDAAHAFGVTVNGRSIFTYGDISITSFHATKIFHTVEGGGIFANTIALDTKIRQLRNFGHSSPVTFDSVGVNAKVSEMHAAMGLCNLAHFEHIAERRKRQYNEYKRFLRGLPIQLPELKASIDHNGAYFAIVVKSENLLLKLLGRLLEEGIQARRYFYPSLSTLPYTATQAHRTPIANSVSQRVACLPLYHHLKITEIHRICFVLWDVLESEESKQLQSGTNTVVNEQKHGDQVSA